MRCNQVEKELPWKLVKLSCLTNNWMFCLTFVIKLRFHAIGMKWMCLVVESFVSDQLENVKSPCATAYVQFLLDYLLMQSMWWAKHAQSYYFINSNEAASSSSTKSNFRLIYLRRQLAAKKKNAIQNWIHFKTAIGFVKDFGLSASSVWPSKWNAFIEEIYYRKCRYLY